MLGDGQELVDGTDPLDVNSVLSKQLGNWRFDKPDLVDEKQGHPLNYFNVKSIPDWLGSAAEIDTENPAWLVYPERDDIRHHHHTLPTRSKRRTDAGGRIRRVRRGRRPATDEPQRTPTCLWNRIVQRVASGAGTTTVETYLYNLTL